MAGRELWAGLHLLDRQLIDREGTLCGNVDDLELTAGDSGALYVTAIHSGPGELSRRLGHDVLGKWLEDMHAYMDDPKPLRPIPFERVTEVGSAVTLDAVEGDLPTAATQRWVRDHIIGHIPGATHATERSEQ
jgi:hypothetical protein